MPNNKNPQPTTSHHYVRTLFASLFGVIALWLIILSILVSWLSQTLTNTGQFVSTVSPLVGRPAVQNFVVDKASSALLDNNEAPVRDIAQQLLTSDQIANKTDDQLRAEVKPILQDSIRSVIASPAFAALWKDTSRSVHTQLMSQLNSSATTINLNFHPLIVGVIDELSQTKLSFVKDKLDLKPDVGQLTMQGKQLDNVRHVYNYFKTATIAIIAGAVVAATLSILLSVHHLKTLRRILLATGIFAALLFGLLSATSLINLSGQDAVQQKMAIALVDGITAHLRMALLVIAVLGIGGAIGSKLYSVMARRAQPKPLGSKQA